MEKLFRFLFHRVVLVTVCLLVQVAALLLVLVGFSQYFLYFYIFCLAVSLWVVLYIVNNRLNPAYKIAWIIPILLFPVFGGLLFLMLGGSHLSRRELRRLQSIQENFGVMEENQGRVMERLMETDREAAHQALYLQKHVKCPVYGHTSAAFLPSGEEKLKKLTDELKRAEKFIFLEYFLIEEGYMWDSILAILEEKAAQGVDVRVIYDDMGCMMTLPVGYDRKLEKKGIRCRVFNPYRPVLSNRFNNRDHRKICVIDGCIGFTGGINLADEYTNAVEKHGHWKDCAVVLQGDAVWSLTVMFLSIWDFITGEKEQYHLYRPGYTRVLRPPSTGFVLPYCDSPLDQETVGENVYLNLIAKAKQEIFICTPYLIIGNEMMAALCNAAKMGVDVRIVTPHIADNGFVHAVTQAHYEQLAEAGVRIYEYTPGFIHAKMFVVDSLYGVVGTINMDFRSLYLHFECAAWLYAMPCILDMRYDFLKMLRECQQLTWEQCRDVKWYIKLQRSLLRVFAPLM